MRRFWWCHFVPEIKDEMYEIGIHIADVSHYVKRDRLDEEAMKGDTYNLPDRVNPMLPEKISNELCSLRPHEDKLCFSPFFILPIKAWSVNIGLAERWSILIIVLLTKMCRRSLIKTPVNMEEIGILHEIAQRFRKQRNKKGAINFFRRSAFQAGWEGKPIVILVKEAKNPTADWEFMLLANRTVAVMLRKSKSKRNPFRFLRIHDTPVKEKVAPFVGLQKNTDTISIQKRRRHCGIFQPDCYRTWKANPNSMCWNTRYPYNGKGCYTTENIRSTTDLDLVITAITSPIRRYPDVSRIGFCRKFWMKNTRS